MAKSSSTDVTSSPHPSNHCSITCPTPSTPVLAAASSLPRPVPPFLTVETSLTSALDFAPRHCNPGMPTYSTRQDRHVMVLCPSPSSLQASSACDQVRTLVPELAAASDFPAFIRPLASRGSGMRGGLPHAPLSGGVAAGIAAVLAMQHTRQMLYNSDSQTQMSKKETPHGNKVDEEVQPTSQHAVLPNHA
ncbi:predicted protein [Plenodomus lingam JN3]|uniref:Predicted protein n=1 Tax=Leptosphaeria maculans (strain JN3 / isolate v23.1.3 / race Av1-4-5-6-7-8) TaxID=985895 RepID=E4ZXN9_LEPMJ|nr:predicted protein [Plenodomus lingam JN3]CBX96134.1 predicted protein [Plenodomus lingam JN3]